MESFISALNAKDQRDARVHKFRGPVRAAFKLMQQARANAERFVSIETSEGAQCPCLSRTISGKGKYAGLTETIAVGYWPKPELSDTSDFVVREQVTDGNQVLLEREYFLQRNGTINVTDNASGTYWLKNTKVDREIVTHVQNLISDMRQMVFP